MWEYIVTLVDSFGKTSSLKYQLDVADATGAGYDTAASLANQIRGALVDITDAFVQSERIVSTVSTDNQLPAGNVMISNEAALFVHLNAPTEKQKLHLLRVPAITMTHVDNNGDIIEDAQVVAFVQQVAQGALVSDGEKIDVATGNAGIAYGYLRSKKATY